MNVRIVRLAAQVLSNSVGDALVTMQDAKDDPESTKFQDAAGTADFCK